MPAKTVFPFLLNDNCESVIGRKINEMLMSLYRAYRYSSHFGHLVYVS